MTDTFDVRQSAPAAVLKARRGLPLSLLLLLPVSAAIGWWLLELGAAMPPSERVLAVEHAELMAQPDQVGALPVDLPHDWRDGFPEREGWYRFAIDFAVPPNRLWGVLIPHVDQSVHVYLNGELLGGQGSASGPPARASLRPVYVRVPNGLLSPGSNEFHVRVQSFPAGWGRLEGVLIGPDEVLGPVFQRWRFVQVDLLWFFLAVSVGMAGVSGLLAWLRPRDAAYRWLAAVIGCWSLLSLTSILDDPPLAPEWMTAWQGIASTGFCAASFLFALRFIDARRPALETIVLLGAAAGVAATLAVAALAPEWIRYPRAASPGLQMLLGPFVVLQLVRRYRETRDQDLFLLLYTGAIVVAFGTFSWLSAVGVSGAVGGRYLYYATPLMLAVIAAVLMRRFVNALEAAEQWADVLEARVAEKSSALEQNYRRLAALEQEWALAQERERIMRDVHDGVGGHLVAALARLRGIAGGDAALREMLEGALTDLRLVIDSLENTGGDLDVALGMLRSRMHSQLQAAALQMRWEVGPLPRSDAWTPSLLLQVMRIVQEAISNVIRHAAASTVHFRAVAEGGGIRITISDDGCGLPGDSQVRTGRGLRNMARRAEVIGATLRVSSNAQGTEVSLLLPG